MHACATQTGIRCLTGNFLSCLRVENDGFDAEERKCGTARLRRNGTGERGDDNTTSTRSHHKINKQSLSKKMEMHAMSWTYVSVCQKVSTMVLAESPTSS